MTSAIAKEFTPSRLDTVNGRHAGGFLLVANGAGSLSLDRHASRHGAA